MSLSTPDLSSHRFVRACLRQPVDRTPVWFLRQAGRYMPEYMEVRRHHSLIEICKRPELAAEVTVTSTTFSASSFSSSNNTEISGR